MHLRRYQERQHISFRLIHWRAQLLEPFAQSISSLSSKGDCILGCLIGQGRADHRCHHRVLFLQHMG